MSQELSALCAKVLPVTFSTHVSRTRATPGSPGLDRRELSSHLQDDAAAFTRRREGISAATRVLVPTRHARVF